MKLLLLFSLLFGFPFSISVQDAAQSKKTSTEFSHALERVVFLGASVSDGFGNNLPPSVLMEQAITVKHNPVEKQASSLFFLNPEGEGKRQVDRAQFLKSSLVIGIDFLFWYGYGVMAIEQRTGPDKREESEAAVAKRLRLLEKGLAELDRLQVPLVVGDIPDMFGAEESMLSPQMVPSPMALEKLNQRIASWAKEKKQVLVLPLREWVQELRSGKVKLIGKDGKAKSIASAELLQDDRLHPSELGVVITFAKLLECLHSWPEVDAKSMLQFDLGKTLRERGLSIQTINPSK